MIDLDSLRGIVSRATGTGWQAAYRQDVEALVAEVERLRVMREEMPRAHDFAKAKAAANERASVVRYLRSQEPGYYDNMVLAEHIERGEHRREEEP